MDSSTPNIGSKVKVGDMKVGATYVVEGNNKKLVGKEGPKGPPGDKYFILKFENDNDKNGNPKTRNEDWQNEFVLVEPAPTPASGGKRLSRRKRKNNKSRKGRRKSYRRRR